MGSIFLSSRAGDSPQTAGRIHDHIVATFGAAALVDGAAATPPGVEMRQALDGVMQSQSVALIVIGPHWLDVTTPSGQRRLDDPFDMVRLQIEAALRWRVPIIPLLVEGAALPPDTSLPPSIGGLAGYPSMLVRNDPYFAADMETVATAVSRWVPRLPSAPPVGQNDRLVRRYGVIFGLLLVGLDIAAVLISALVNAALGTSAQGPGTGIVIAAVLLTLLGYFLAGFYPARRTGEPGSGRGAALTASLINGLSFFLLGAFALVAFLVTPSAPGSDSVQQALGQAIGLLVVLLIALVGIAWLVAQVIVGVGFGALGGLLGKRSARSHAQHQPAPAVPAMSRGRR